METFFLVGFFPSIIVDAANLEGIAERNAEVPVSTLLRWRYDTNIK